MSRPEKINKAKQTKTKPANHNENLLLHKLQNPGTDESA